MSRFAIALSCAFAAALGVMTPAQAQYDREGRYVPSPMGVPRDPHARPIPNYPGTPGGANGTPWEPPLAPSSPLAPLNPRVGTPPRSGSAPISVARCEASWSPKFRMPKAEFDARCRKLLRARKNS